MIEILPSDDTNQDNLKANRLGSHKVFLTLLLGVPIAMGIIVYILIESSNKYPSAEQIDIFIGLFIAVILLSLLVAYIYLNILIYKTWRFVIHYMSSNNMSPSIDTPGQAVGFSFIPLYNLYWNFRVFGQLPKDFNQLAEKMGNETRLSEGLGSAIPILGLIGFIVPGVGLISLILIPILIVNANLQAKKLLERN